MQQPFRSDLSYDTTVLQPMVPATPYLLKQVPDTFQKDQVAL